MADIKVRDVEKKGVKTINKAVVQTERFKDTIVRTKEKAEESGFPYLREHINTNEETIILAKDELCDTDYKVIKALEKLLLSDTDLHKTRQALRDKINELEQTNNGG